MLDCNLLRIDRTYFPSCVLRTMRDEKTKRANDCRRMEQLLQKALIELTSSSISKGVLQ
jgi:hypothetical protein